MGKRFIERTLLRCVILGTVVLIIWFSFFVAADEVIYRVHGSFFGEISVRQFQVIHYCGMGLTKIFVFVFFLFPYVAMRWADGKQKSSA